MDIILLLPPLSVDSSLPIKILYGIWGDFLALHVGHNIKIFNVNQLKEINKT